MAFFPEFRPMRSFILQNFRSDNDRPKIWRWLYKQHVPESISQFMPYCTKYPDGVPIDAGDAWFKEVFAPEVCANPEVNRFISSRQLDDPRVNPFQRIVEIWFDDSEGWRKVFVDKAAQFTKPTWATLDKVPYFEPFKDFVGVFILDRPESDHMQQWRGYITTR